VTTCLLDTNILIRVLRGEKGAKAKLASLIGAGNLLAACPVTVAEIYDGMKPREREATVELMEALIFLPISRETAAAAGTIRRTWREKGRQLTLADCMIAAICIERNCTLVTENKKDFPMPEIRIESVQTS